MVAKFVQTVPVSASRGVGRQVQDFGNLEEAEFFPKSKVNDSPLIGGEFAQGGGQFDLESGFVGVGSSCKKFGGFLGERMCGFATSLLATDEVYGSVVGHPEEKAPGVLHTPE